MRATKYLLCRIFLSLQQSLNEFFQCHICYERLKNPHLCPHCSKPCCLECYKVSEPDCI